MYQPCTTRESMELNLSPNCWINWENTLELTQRRLLSLKSSNLWWGGKVDLKNHLKVTSMSDGQKLWITVLSSGITAWKDILIIASHQEADHSGNGPGHVPGFLCDFLEKFPERFRVAQEFVSSEQLRLTLIIHPTSEFWFGWIRGKLFWLLSPYFFSVLCFNLPPAKFLMKATNWEIFQNVWENRKLSGKKCAIVGKN